MNTQIEPSQILALYHLLQEQHVSRAAEKMSISQSSMSHRLKRLRDDLDDPLLVRQGRHLVPTKRAAQIAGPLHAAMTSLEKAVAPPGVFSPSAIRDPFRIYLPDLLAPLLPEISRELREEAPHLELDVRMVPGSLTEHLADRVPALAFAPAAFAAPDLKSRPLGQLRFGVVGRSDHPALRRKPTLKKWLSYGHVVVEVGNSGKNPVEEALRRRKLQRQVILRVPSFLTGLHFVAASDCLMNAPLSLARTAAKVLSLGVRPLPIELPSVPFSMLWHERHHSDPAHGWLRQKAFRLMEEAVD